MSLKQVAAFARVTAPLRNYAYVVFQTPCRWSAGLRETTRVPASLDKFDKVYAFFMFLHASADLFLCPVIESSFTLPLVMCTRSSQVPANQISTG
jgi:hypothetical protein